jgi:uncharacterized FlgJ-related protein
MKQHLPLKYECLDKFNEIYESCDEKLKVFLDDLRELIHYQMREITSQRSQIIAIKHKYAWRNYETSETQEKSVDKPPKSGNMSC